MNQTDEYGSTGRPGHERRAPDAGAAQCFKMATGFNSATGFKFAMGFKMAIGGWGRSGVFGAQPPGHTCCLGSKTQALQPPRRRSSHRLMYCRRCFLAAFCLLCLVALTEAHQLQAAGPSTVALEARPYRVLITIAFEQEAALSPSYRRRAIESVVEIVDRTIGQMWSADVVENSWLFPASAVGLRRVTAGELKTRVNTAKYDKVFPVTVGVSGARFYVSGREWDAQTRSIGPVSTAQTFERREVDDVIVDLVQQLFRSVFSVERVDGNDVVLRVQAGRYPARDPQAAQVRTDDLIQPFFRYLDQQRVVRRIQFLPWSYLVVKSVDEGRVKCSLITGLRAPLGGSRRRLVEVMALGVHPRFGSTRLRLVPRANRSKPMIGYTVTVVTKLYPNDESKAQPLKLVTDRTGVVNIPASTAGPLVWLYVHSGESLLTRVPFIPGLRETDTMDLPDDSLRLKVEGQRDLLLNRLVDTVARRAALIAGARRLAREGDWKNVDRRLAELDKLPGSRWYQDQLTIIRVPALEAALIAKNRRAETNIRRVCSRAGELIDRYLAEDKIRTLKTDMQELEKFDKEDKRLLQSK
jgi:hypothetical protein